MKRYILRVWLPDMPGALGRVASALGSVNASLTGIDILDRGAGWAIDELVIEIADDEQVSIQQLATALTGVDGVKIEDIRSTGSQPVDPRLDALETAAELVELQSSDALRTTLVERAQHDMSADWVTLTRLDRVEVVVVRGEAPSAPWLNAFVAGSRSTGALIDGDYGPADIALAELPHDSTALIVGREGRPFHSRERRQLNALARIADQRLSDLSK